jgi:hypothetical protein
MVPFFIFGDMERAFKIENRFRPEWNFLDDNSILEPYKHVFDDSKAEGLAVGFDVNVMFVYLANMLDKGSPSRNMGNYRDKIIYSCDEAGLKQRDGGYPEWMEQIINGCGFVNHCAARMMYVQNNNKLAMLNAFQEAFYKSLENLKNNPSAYKETGEISKRIEELLIEINNGPVSKQREVILYGLINEVSLGIKPEEHIKMFETRKEVFPELYQN